MKMKLVFILTLLWMPFAHATDVRFEQAYARATPPHAINSAVFVDITNPSNQEKHIVAASTPAAGKVELHEVVKEDGMMKMRQISQINLPAKSTTHLKPGGLHIMLFDLTKPLREGESIAVSVYFDDGQQQIFVAPIKNVITGMKHHH